jgi:hypothetical protein
MGFIQKLVTTFVPAKTALAMEEESRQWMMRCDCGHEISIWDAGGIRFGAKGSPKTLYRCPKCGPKMHTVYRKP